MSSVVAAAAALLAASASAASITPTQQVINMLSEMHSKGEKMMEVEKKTFAAYAEWVDDRAKEISFEIRDGAAQIEELISFVTKADSDAAALGREISSLDAEINKLEGEKATATSNRKEEHEEYLKMSQDYAESVDALERAIQVLGSQDFDRAQAESMLQKMASTVPGMPRVLAAFMQEKSRGSALRGDGAPAVAAYEFQAGGIMELLESLLSKFKGELSDVEEAESNQAHEFALVELHLSDTVAKDTSDRDEKAVARGKTQGASAKAKGELTETQAEKASDESLKMEIETTYRAKSAQFEENQAVRVQELEAIAKAVEIISSPEVSSSYGKHVNLAQMKPTSLLQLSRSRHLATAKQSAASLLNKAAIALNSKALADAASHALADPFAKVIGMIEGLLDKLKEEAAAEADHRSWCDEQLKHNKLKRNKKTAQVGQLSATIDGQSATVYEQGATVTKLVAEQGDLTKAIQEATAQREAEKAENTATIADAASGIDAVSKAIVILKEFYSSQEASFLQQKKQVPEMAAYKGMQSSTGGVVGMLEVIESDFSRLKAETEASEKSAATEYDSFMDASQASKKAKHDAEVQLRLDKDQTEFEQSQTEKELRLTEEELGKANEYYGFLKPSCLEVHVSWEERVMKRKEEIEALKQAYTLLDQKS